MKVVTLLSGGLDSTVLLYHLLREGHDGIRALSFDYGQRHAIELRRARWICEAAGVPHWTVNLTSVQPFLQGSCLTSSNVDVPEGHYTDESMKTTVVPNRNMIMLSIAAGWAISGGFDAVACAVHAGDHTTYPDCRPEFVGMMAAALGRCHYTPIDLLTPFVKKKKAEIVTLGEVLGVSFQLTWSCYKGGHKHCGKCGACVERKEAFKLAGVKDPTPYEE